MKTTVILGSETMGRGDDALGGQIMAKFLGQLLAADRRPDAIVFYNSAVKLLTADSGVVDALDGLFKAGVDLVACGTCVAYFQLNEKIAVGRVSNMQEIVSLVTGSQSVITI